jgi:hypothetical protein
MLEVNLPVAVSELTDAFNAYEQALQANDIPALNDLFWDSALALRYGARENELQYSHADIAAFRIKRGAVNQSRTLTNTRITTFGPDFGVANTEYIVAGTGKVGRQSQTWMRTERGWKIVSAHVSFGQ